MPTMVYIRVYICLPTTVCTMVGVHLPTTVCTMVGAYTRFIPRGVHREAYIPGLYPRVYIGCNIPGLYLRVYIGLFPVYTSGCT